MWAALSSDRPWTLLERPWLRPARPKVSPSSRDLSQRSDWPAGPGQIEARTGQLLEKGSMPLLVETITKLDSKQIAQKRFIQTSQPISSCRTSPTH